MITLRVALQKCVRRASILGNSKICHHTSRSFNAIYISRLAYSNANSEVAENASQHAETNNLSKADAIKSPAAIANDPEANSIPSGSENKPAPDMANDPESNSTPPVIEDETVNKAQTSKNLDFRMPQFSLYNAQMGSGRSENKPAPDMTNDPEANSTPPVIEDDPENKAQKSKNLNFRRYHISVRGFAKDIPRHALEKFYSQFGTVIRTLIFKNEQGPEPPKALVMFSSKKAMQRALESSPHQIHGEKVVAQIGTDQKELNLRVKDLSPETTEESLRDFYSKFGNLTYCAVRDGSERGQPKIGYVTFASQDELDRALDAQPHLIDGSEVFLQYATPELDLMVKEVPKGITEESLRTFFSQYGQVRRCEWMTGKTGLYNHAFVCFSTLNEVNRAMEARPHIIDKKLLKTDFARKQGLFPILVGFLPENVTMDSLFKAFSKFGKIVHLELHNGGMPGPFGIINYGTPQEAYKALNAGSHEVDGVTVNLVNKEKRPEIQAYGIKSHPDIVNDPETGEFPPISESKALNTTHSSKNLEFRRYHIWLTNLSMNITEDALQEFYSRFGQVIRCQIKFSDQRNKRGGTVVFSSKKAMYRALSSLPHRICGEMVLAQKGSSQTELYLRVLDLSPETTEESLRDFYSKFGNLTHCVVKYNPETGKSAIGYVAFASQDELDSALDAQPHLIDGSEVFLRYGTDELDLMVKEVPNGITEESLRTFFSQYGQVRRCEWIIGKTGIYNHAFVSFSTLDEVNRAMADRPHVIDRKLLRTEYAGKCSTYTIFVGSLPQSTTTSALFKAFNKFGKIVYLEVLVQRFDDSPMSPERDRIGFVHYGTQQEADNVLNSGPHMVEGAIVKVELNTEQSRDNKINLLL